MALSLISYIEPSKDYVAIWREMKRRGIAQRGGWESPVGELIPLATCDDVGQLIEWWERALWIEAIGHMLTDQARADVLARWNQRKQEIREQIARAEPTALYPSNEWLWETVIKDIALYLTELNQAEQAGSALSSCEYEAPGWGGLAWILGGFAGVAIGNAVICYFRQRKKASHEQKQLGSKQPSRKPAMRIKPGARRRNRKQG